LPFPEVAHVCFGSKADSCSAATHVRFGPIADSVSIFEDCMGHKSAIAADQRNWSPQL
jgi:hypothetical protein